MPCSAALLAPAKNFVKSDVFAKYYTNTWAQVGAMSDLVSLSSHQLVRVMTGSDLQAPHHHVAQPAPSVTAMVLADVHCIETHERPVSFLQDGRCFDEPGTWVLAFDNSQPF